MLTLLYFTNIIEFNFFLSVKNVIVFDNIDHVKYSFIKQLGIYTNTNETSYYKLKEKYLAIQSNLFS